MIQIVVDRNAKSFVDDAGDHFSIPLTFKLQTNLPAYVERFVAATPLQPGSQSQRPSTRTQCSAVFQRTPKEFRHLLDTSVQLFPSLPLPRWPQQVDEKVIAEHQLPQKDYIAAVVETILRFVVTLEEVVMSELFFAFVDHGTCPVGLFEQAKLRKRPSEDEHNMGILLSNDRALQPLVTAVKAATEIAPLTSLKSGSSINDSVRSLKNLSIGLCAFVAEASSLRTKVLKEVGGRLQRGRRSGLIALGTQRERTLDELSLMVAKSGGAKTIEESFNAVHLGDPVCSSTTGVTGMVTYVGPPTQKKSERLYGVLWDRPVAPAASADAHMEQQQRVGKLFACGADEGTICKASQLYADPGVDPTIAGLLRACMSVDRALNPAEGGEFGLTVLSTNAAALLGSLAAYTHVFQCASQYLYRFITAHKTLSLAAQWLHQNSGTPSTALAPAYPGSKSLFDKAVVAEQARKLETTLQQGMLEFRNVWVCMSAARVESANTIADLFAHLVSRFDRVEGASGQPRQDAVGMLAPQPCGSVGGTLSAMFAEVDALYEQCCL